jgi:hypothetical protein
VNLAKRADDGRRDWAVELRRAADPVRVSSAGGGHPCTDQDSDCDGVTNDLEMWIATTFAPTYYLDEEEGVDTVAFPSQVTSDVTCVWQGTEEETVQFGGDDYLMTIVTAWEEDYLEYLSATSIALGIFDRGPWALMWDVTQGAGSLITTGDLGVLPSLENMGETASNTATLGLAEDITNPEHWTKTEDFVHFGDTERLRLCIRASDRPFDGALAPGEHSDPYVGRDHPRYFHIMSLEFRRHGGTHSYLTQDIAYWEATSRPVVLVSEGKHGQYTSLDECRTWTAHKGGIESISWSEDCSYLTDSPGGVLRPYEWPAFESLNVGERLYPHEPEIIETLFPGERAWGSDDFFCGGHRDEVGSPSARADYLVAVFSTGEKVCSGGTRHFDVGGDIWAFRGERSRSQQGGSDRAGIRSRIRAGIRTGSRLPHVRDQHGRWRDGRLRARWDHRLVNHHCQSR